MYPRLIVAVMVAAFAVAVFAQAPAPSTDCSSVLVSLTPCLNFVMTGSKEAKPSSACCSALSSAVASNAVCLCQALNSNAAAGLGVNQTKAGTLPTACNIKANIGQCKTITSPSPKSSSSSPSPKSSSSSASSPVSSPTTAKAPAAASPNKAKSVAAPAPAVSPSMAATPSVAPSMTPEASAPTSTAPTPSSQETTAPAPAAMTPSSSSSGQGPVAAGPGSSAGQGPTASGPGSSAGQGPTASGPGSAGGSGNDSGASSMSSPLAFVLSLSAFVLAIAH